MCEQKKATKVIPTDRDFINANIKGFNNNVGKITNYVTSMYAICKLFTPESEEYKMLTYRIMCGQKYQQDSIDSTKGIPTTLKVVKIYEEMNRVLSGRADFNNMIERVGESFRRKLLDDIYALWMTASADDFGGTVFFPTAGAYDEEAMLELIEHVEAAAGGKPATIIGTAKAVRNLKPGMDANTAKEELYSLGYFGKFYGTDVVKVPQRHKIGTTDFVFDDGMLSVIAGDEKPIKCVYEGDSLLSIVDPLQNADLTNSYLYGDHYGLGIVTTGNTGIGRYQIV